MTIASGYLLVVLVAAMVFFYKGWVRQDLTALMLMLSLMVPLLPDGRGGLTAVLTPVEAFSGFGSPALILVACMFIISGAMVRTGGAHLLGDRLLAWAGKSEWRMQASMVVVITVFSGFINDTTTVLIWMPMVLSICRQRGIAPSRVLMLLAFASLLGGQWTLIGTRSNLILSDYLRAKTGEGLAFFSFTPVAACVWLCVIVFVAVIGRRLLPRREMHLDTVDRYEVNEYLTEVLVDVEEEGAGRTLQELALPKKDIKIIGVFRGSEHFLPDPDLRVHSGDVLVAQGRISRITELLAGRNFKFRDELRVGEHTLKSLDLRMVECLIAPGSPLAGQDLESCGLLEEYPGITVLGIRHHGRTFPGRPLAAQLSFGDSLLLIGHDREIERLRHNPGVLLLETRPLPVMRKAASVGSLALMGAVLLLSASRLLSPMVIIPAAALVAILTGLIHVRDAYRSLDIRALVVVGSLIPFGLAMEKTGAAHWLGEVISNNLQGMGAHTVFAALLLITIILTQVIENAAVAVILAPLAFEMATASGAPPEAFLLGVAICASAGFMSPIAHESNILVFEPGSYHFRDFLRLGAPFACITWVVTLVVVPFLYGF